MWGACIAVLLVAWVAFADLYDSTSSAILSVETGECFILPEDDGSAVERVETPGCDKPHDAQVFYRFAPGKDMADDAKDSRCLEEGGVNVAVDQLPDSAGIDFLDINVGRTSFTSRTLCYIWHPQNITGSYVVAEPLEGD